MQMRQKMSKMITINENAPQLGDAPPGRKSVLVLGK